jgi:hypothetical protein
MKFLRRRRDLLDNDQRRLSKTKQLPIADVDDHPHGSNRPRNATGETTTMTMTTMCHGENSTEPNTDCHHPHPHHSNALITTMISPHRIISLGMGVVSKHTGLVEQFIIPAGIMHCPLLTMRRGDTFLLDEEITGTSSSVSDISTEDDNIAIAAQKQPKSFLRTADLGAPLLQPADVEEENWIALDNGMGGPSPMAQQTVQALFEHGRCILSRSDLWTAADAKTQKLTTTGTDNDDDWKTTTFQDSNKGCDNVVVVDDLYDDTVLVWSGKFDEACYGHDIPAIRSAALIHGMSALDLLELLVDSNRVQEYNALSLGRTDDLVLTVDDTTNDNNPAADGFGLCTKLMTSQTKPPLIRKILTFTSLLHARQDGEHTGTYYLITRGVTRSTSSATAVETAAALSSGGSEILLGVNRIQHVTDDCCLLTSVNHIKSSLVPMMIAKRIGLQAAVNFVHDLRKVAATSTAV